MNTQNKPRKLLLNQETLHTLTFGKQPDITRTCLESVCIQATCIAVGK